jgi:hypothetical protein
MTTKVRISNVSWFEQIKANIRDTNAAADIGGNLADKDVSEEEALEAFAQEARTYFGPDASAKDLQAFSDTAYFEFLHSRGLA